MTPELFRRAQEVFASAVARSAGARAGYLDGACGGDAELRREVESLLASHEAASDGFLESRTIETPPSVMARLAARQGGSLAPGDRLGSYEIVDRLGAGGMGEVYRARDSKLERDVAVKVLSDALAEDVEALARFEREARAVAALSHPNILSIFDFGKQGEKAYAVTELLEGQTLRERLKKGPIETEDLLGLAAQILAGLQAAHAKGVIHRDLKPENLFVTKDGRVKVLDFGLAKRSEPVRSGEETSAPTAAQHTTPGTVMGTLGYMSPEQLLGLAVDERSDLFSLGIILHEMASGRAPFRGSSAVAVADAILHAEAPKLADETPEGLRRIVGRLLAKEPDQRYAAAAEALAEVTDLVESRRRGLSRGARIGLAAAAILVIALGAWFWRRTSREHWVHEVATPEITKLVEARENIRATALLRQARAILPSDPTLEKLWQKATGEASIKTEPPGAEVAIRPYAGDPNAWESLGKTPLEKVRVPDAVFVWRISKEGFGPLEFLNGPDTWSAKLVPAAVVAPGMTVVLGDEAGLGQPVSEAPTVHLADFLIDQHEVTNEEYKKFVDAGGYVKREFWKQPFVKDARPMTWEATMPFFRDGTGRPGPATWEAGTFPRGTEKHPVAGVSWYEAAAYAEFAGKSLPTAYHWSLAAETGFARFVVPGSNFGGTSTRAVGDPRASSGSGTTDMAGNVKEWCWNEEREGRRFILGGGFGEDVYMFQQTDARSPWDRRPNFGFRCVKYVALPPEPAFAKIDIHFRDYGAEKPVPIETVRLYKGLYAYDHTPLNARVEERRTTESWIYERVSLDAAYGGERVTVHLFLPKNSSPPFQTIVYFPGANAMFDERFDADAIPDDWEFLVKSGRAFVQPVYKSTFERRDGFTPVTYKPGLFRDHLLLWSKDLGRTLDYLQSRSDLDDARRAYLGFSWGGKLASVLLAVNDRFQAAILAPGGLPLRYDVPEADGFNFAPLVRIPVLMLNGRYDELFPPELSQTPLFQTLGTPAGDKRHVVYDAGHADLPHKEVVRETLDWLDRYLGPVKR